MFFIYIISLVICLVFRKILFSKEIKKVKHLIGFVPWHDGIDENKLFANMALIFALLPSANTVCAVILVVFTLFNKIGNTNNHFLNKDI